MITPDGDRPGELRVLHIEDNPDDATLIERALRAAGLVVNVKLVDTEGTFRDALEAFDADVILADYQLPSFNGMAALDMARRSAPDVPFIFVSGAMGEERAIETLHHGAADYILKDRLARLAPAVSRAVEERAERVERARVASELAAYQRRVVRLLDSMPAGFLELDGHFRIVFANELARAFVPGYPQVVDQLIWEAYPGVAGTVFEGTIRRAMEGRLAIEVEGPMELYGAWFRVNVFPTEAGVAIHFRDLGEQHRAEAARREAEAMYRTLVEQMPASTYVVEIDETQGLRPVYVSPQFEETLGYTLEEWQADPNLLCSLVDPLDHDDVVALTADAMASGSPFEAVYRTATKSGRTIWVHDRAGVVAGRERLTIEGVILDISEQKRLEGDLQKALAEALGASVLKSRLITNTTHELMTPLTVIYGMNEMMLDTDLDAMQRSLVVRIGEAGRRLRALIRDMLDFAKLSEGNLELKPRDIDLRQFIDSVGRLEEPAAAEKGLELLWTVDPGTTACIFSDPARLRQVLRILVANAVKFSDQGKVALCASPSEGTEATSVVFSVADTGIGIAPSDRTQVFQPFWQADMSDSRRQGGAGLGLALASELVSALGGTIGFDSAPGVGSTFWIRIPTRLGVPTPVQTGGTAATPEAFWS